MNSCGSNLWRWDLQGCNKQSSFQDFMQVRHVIELTVPFFSFQTPFVVRWISRGWCEYASNLINISNSHGEAEIIDSRSLTVMTLLCMVIGFQPLYLLVNLFHAFFTTGLHNMYVHTCVMTIISTITSIVSKLYTVIISYSRTTSSNWWLRGGCTTLVVCRISILQCFFSYVVNQDTARRMLRNNS